MDPGDQDGCGTAHIARTDAIFLSRGKIDLDLQRRFFGRQDHARVSYTTHSGDSLLQLR